MASQPSFDVARLLADQRWLAGLVRGLSSDEHALEDVLQETRLRVWRHPAPDAARAGGWVRRIASNVAHSLRSSDAARRARESAVARPEGVHATDEIAARVEMQQSVAAAVLALDEPYRTAILLRFFEDLPPRAIAERLDVPVETVRTRLKRGLAQLRSTLDQRYGARDAWSAVLAAGLPGSGGIAAVSSASKVVVATVVVLVLGAVAWKIGVPVRGRAVLLESFEPREFARENVTKHSTAQLDDPAIADSARRLNASTANATFPFEHVRLVGRVIDADKNVPVAGAVVRLLYYDTSRKLVGAEARSQAGGDFALDVKDVARDYCAGKVANPDFATASIPPTSLKVMRSLEGFEADLGTVLLQRGTLVTGRVVMLPERAPVAGAQLFVRDSVSVAPNDFGPDSVWSAGTSRGDGSFELPRRVLAVDGALAILAVSNGRIGFALLRPERDRERLDDLEVPIEPQGALSVRVIDDHGEPVGDVGLTAYPTFPPLGQRDYGEAGPPPPVIMKDPWTSIFLATTSADGRARFPYLPEGREDLLFENQIGHPQSYRIHAVAQGWPELFESVLIARGQESTLEIKLRPARLCLVRGRILDPNGTPIPGALVRVHGFAPTRSAADGRYATEARKGWLSGVTIEVSADGFGPADFSAMRDWSRAHLTVRRDEPTALPCEELERDFTLARSLTVRGRVVDETGAPVVHAKVQAKGLDRARQNWVKLDAVGGSTDAKGGFVIDGVCVDFLSLTVEPPEGFLQPLPTRMVPGDQNLIVKVLRRPTATSQVIATIVDSETGGSVEPAHAYAQPLNTYATRFPSAHCTLGQVVADKLFVGQWELHVTLNDGRHGRARFDVLQPDETVRLKVAIGNPGIVEGAVFVGDQPLQAEKNKWWVWVRPSSYDSADSGHALDGDGRPVSGITDGCAVLDENGQFRVGRLPPGVPIQFVIDGAERFASETVLLASGETRRVEFHLTKPALVQWFQSEPLPPGRLLIQFAPGDGPFTRLFEAPIGSVGTRLAEERLSPGHVCWRAEFTSSVEYPARVRVARGELDLAAGETKIVDVVGFD